jgi:hypothetical protein
VGPCSDLLLFQSHKEAQLLTREDEAFWRDQRLSGPKWLYNLELGIIFSSLNCNWSISPKSNMAHTYVTSPSLAEGNFHQMKKERKIRRDLIFLDTYYVPLG